MKADYFENCFLQIIEKKPLKFYVTKQEQTQAQTITNLKRKQNFLLGRHYAHQFLKNYNYPLQTLPIRKNGAIVWPGSIKGSISHSKKKIAFCLSDWKNILSIGIDLERIDRNPSPKIYQIIKHPAEKFFSPNSLETLKIFCIKEAIIKCFGHLEQKIRFQEICIHSLFSCTFCIPSQKISNASAYLAEKENCLLAAFILKKNGVEL